MLDAAYSDVEWVDPEVFSHLTRLETLHLEAGRLTAVDNLSSMTQLRRIYLQQNRLTQVVRLDALYSLVFIDLSCNRIAHVPAFWLDGLRHLQVIVRTAHMRSTQGLCICRASVRLSVPAWADSSKPAAVGLLLWARRAVDIDRLLRQWRAAGECGQCHVVSVRM